MNLLKRLLLLSKGGASSEYRQVEYLEATGTQYIDTGILFNHGIKITASMGFRSTGNTEALFGARLDGSSTRFLVCYYNGMDIAYNSDGVYDPSTYPVEKGTIYDFVFDTSKSAEVTRYWSGGGNPSTYSVTELNTGVSGYIFAYHRASDNKAVGLSKSMCKSFTIENASGEKLFDGIPCVRIQDSKPGIYDLVGQKFITNSGTGEFIIPTA